MKDFKICYYRCEQCGQAIRIKQPLSLLEWLIDREFPTKLKWTCQTCGKKNKSQNLQSL